jgi:heme-degrading monooxygenase HmoA
MVARTWSGWTRREDADEYVVYIEGTGMREYRETPGNRGAWMLRRDEGDRTEFTTLSFWDSLESIRGFAGDDLDRAVFYPEDDRFLVEREETVKHWTIEEPR